MRNTLITISLAMLLMGCNSIYSMKVTQKDIKDRKVVHHIEYKKFLFNNTCTFYDNATYLYIHSKKEIIKSSLDYREIGIWERRGDTIFTYYHNEGVGLVQKKFFVKGDNSLEFID
ncbi:MAG: hypothetical protein GY827_10720 [Cytophagales bacterium]|nr:hypothetical protein [Cytophagales bacterium]